MNKFYVVLTVGKPIEVQFKKDVSFYEILCKYTDMFGDDLITIATSLEDAMKLQTEWYLNYGDKDITRDIETVHHLEKCYQLEYKEA